MSCRVGHRCGSEPTLLWLWCRLAAAAPIWPLAWELPYAGDMALKKKKKRKKKKHKRQPWGVGGKHAEQRTLLPESFILTGCVTSAKALNLSDLMCVYFFQMRTKLLHCLVVKWTWDTQDKWRAFWMMKLLRRQRTQEALEDGFSWPSGAFAHAGQRARPMNF